MPDDMKNQPLLRIYGVTENGNSILAIVKDFYPYFFVECPYNFTDLDKEQLKSKLSEFLVNKSDLKYEEYIMDIEIVEKVNLYHYTQNANKYIKITVMAPKLVSTLREYFEEGKQIGNFTFSRTTFETKVNFPLRYMIDNGIVGMSWITLKKNTYIIRKNKISTCQLELEISYRDVISHPPEGKFSTFAPLRILSIDIECAAQNGRFPSADIDPVIQISNICVEFGNSEPIVQTMFSFKECAPIAGVDVQSFNMEEKMLEKWTEFVVQLDPDIITGYNINNFDLPYLLNRAEKLKVEKLKKLSKIKTTVTRIKHSKGKSKSFKNRDFIDLKIEGRIILDMFIYIMKEHKLRSFSLNNVSFTFLGEQKEDVHHTMIYDLWNTDPFTRRRLAIYCMKDAYLPLKLAEKLMTIYNFAEMCRVTCTPLNFILTRGQQIKVSSQLHRKALEHNYLIPNIRIKKVDEDEEGYEGAYVLDPVKGFHDIPIVTLDFASLYPSIMMAHNLCYSTLIKSGEEKFMDVNDYFKSPTGDCFVREHVRKGILPIILEELISARKKAKEELKTAKTPELKAVLDGRQLALKISANSVYGFTGAQIGQLPCLQISSSVTAVGREMIEKTRDIILKKFIIENGYEYNSQVIYGDTDSVMIKFGVTQLEQAMKLGKEAAEYVSSHFKKPIKIEFEKIYFPYLLMKKKKYAGLIWTKLDKYDKIDTKGLEAVRRDNCELVRDLVETILKKILLDRSVDDAIQYCKGIISDLLQNKIDISLLVISKSLSKNAKVEDNPGDNNQTKDAKVSNKIKNADKKNTYQGKQAHVELAEKMRKRDEGKFKNLFIF